MDPTLQNTREVAARERLDVPSQASIERKLLVRNGAPITKPPISLPQRNGDLFSRLQTFLPQMEEANKHLETEEIAAEAKFEAPEEDEGPVVELDLACGVFDLQDDTAVAAAERSLINQGVAVEKFSDGSSDSDSSDSDSSNSSSDSEDEEKASEESGDPIDVDEPGPSAAVDKKLNKKGKKPSRHHPGIEELS